MTITPTTTSDLVVSLASDWADGITTTITTTPQIRLVVTGTDGDIMDIVLDDTTHTVTGTIRWDMEWVLVDHIYDPVRTDYVDGEPSISGWELATTTTGWLEAIQCGDVDSSHYGPAEPRDQTPAMPRHMLTRGFRRPAGV